MPTLAAYRWATTGLGPAVELLLRWRESRGKEVPERRGERRGIASRPRPAGPLVWMHAASVGEAQSLLALVERLLADRPRLSILVTTGTVTSAALLAGRLPDRAIHQFVPVDRWAWVERFLTHWRPDLALWVESELWPNLIRCAQAQGIPTMLINGRMSARSFRRWQRWPEIVGPLLRGFHGCLAQSPADAERLEELGAGGVEWLGNLKFGARPLPVDAGARSAMDRNLGDRPRWLAANTHPGEDEIALDAHCRLRKEFPGLVTVIAPRHPQRGAEIAELGRHRGLASARRSLNQPLTENTEIYIADTLGEMGLWYSVGRIAFIGGSLVPVGGHNPLEAAHFDVAMVLGPDRRNNLAAAELLIEAEAALVIESGDGVFGAVRRLLADGGERSRVAQAASAAVSVHGDVLDRIVSRLTPALDSLCRTADAAVDHAPA